MKYGKIVNGVVVQVQSYYQKGFIKIEEKTTCGQILVNGIFTNPNKTKNQLLQEWKNTRAEAVKNIKVTTLAKNTFDGDEISQGRLARAITVMNDTDVTTWVLTNNNPLKASKAELMEALKLAGEAQTALWVK